MQAVQVSEHGGPDALEVVNLPTPTPQAGEVLIRHEAIGVNFVDTQHREGRPYPVALPLIPGIEAAGTVVGLGPDVDGVQPGDRVGFVGYMSGVYAQYSCVPAGRVVPVPAEVTSTLAAASLLQAMTAHAFTHSAAPVSPGDVIVVQAAAGGVGTHLVQMSKSRGATVIATVSSPRKAEAARAAGADHVMLHDDPDLRQRIAHASGGTGVHVVYDGSGRDTFDLSLDVLRATGRLVVYGLTTGPIPPFDVNRLSGITGATSKGSLALTWATLSDYTADRDDLLWRASDVLSWVADGSLRVPIAEIIELADAARAHRLLAERTITGKIVLIP